MAAQHVFAECSAEELGPAEPRRVGAGIGISGVRIATGRCCDRHDRIAQGRGRCQHSEVGELMLARMGDHRDEALEEGQRVEHKGARSVATGAAQ